MVVSVGDDTEQFEERIGLGFCAREMLFVQVDGGFIVCTVLCGYSSHGFNNVNVLDQNYPNQIFNDKIKNNFQYEFFSFIIYTRQT